MKTIVVMASLGTNSMNLPNMNEPVSFYFCMSLFLEIEEFNWVTVLVKKLFLFDCHWVLSISQRL